MVGRCFVVLVLLARIAAADSPKLAEARKAIDAVRYDAAQSLLVDALKDGGNSPKAVAEIYKLSASTAVVLDRRELAEQYYRRWLALDPSASLPGDIAPKIREPFVKAQAYMNAHGRLVAKVSRATTIDVIVETDPLGMAVAVAIDNGAATKLDAEHRAHLPAQGTNVAVLDEYGNHLVELAVPAASSTEQPPIVDERPKPARVSFIRRGKYWAIASGVTLGAGLVFGYLARDANDEVQAIAGSSETHTLADYNAARDRRDRWSVVANALYISGGALAAGAVIMFVTRPRETATVVTPTATSHSAGVSITGAF